MCVNGWQAPEVAAAGGAAEVGAAAAKAERCDSSRHAGASTQQQQQPLSSRRAGAAAAAATQQQQQQTPSRSSGRSSAPQPRCCSPDALPARANGTFLVARALIDGLQDFQQCGGALSVCRASTIDMHFLLNCLDASWYTDNRPASQQFWSELQIHHGCNNAHAAPVVRVQSSSKAHLGWWPGDHMA